MALDENACLEAFLDEYWADVSADRVGELEHYLARYTAIQGRVRREYATLPKSRHEAEAAERSVAWLEQFLPSEQQSPATTRTGNGHARRASEEAGERVRRGLRNVGDFVLLRELGRGGMGIVFQAQQESLHRPVALKVLPAQLTLNDRAMRRFRREAEIMGGLQHPGIIDVYQIGSADGVHFIAMELVEGASLDRVIDRMHGESFGEETRRRIQDVVALSRSEVAAPPPVAPPGNGAERRPRGTTSASNKSYIETAVRLVAQVAQALHYAHQADVIHRDVKPSNILVRTDGSGVLTDFGLARREGLPSVSATGDFAGTPNYVSPEQAMARRVPVDHRTDVFSLGATLYELLTLEKAFPGENSHQVLSRILSKQPADPARLNSALAPDLVTIIERALEKDPDKRYPTALAFAEDLTAFVEYRPIRARRTPTVVRAMRWVRREPFRAAFATLLGVALPITLALGVSLFTTTSELQSAERSLERARLPAQLEEAHLDLARGDWDEARAGFTAYLAQRPGSVEAAAGLALEALHRREPAEAFAALERVTETDEDRTVLDFLRVEILRDLGRAAEAEALRRGLREPRTALDHYLAAAILLRDAEFSAPLDEDRDRVAAQRAWESLEYLRASIAIDSERPYVHMHLAWAAWLAGDEAAARGAERSLLAKWSELPVAWFYVGLARELHDPAGAPGAYERALERDPTLTAARTRLALRVHEADPDGSVERFEALAKDEAQSVDARANLALMYRASGRHEEALAAAQEALTLDPESAHAQEVLGLVASDLGDLETARAAFEQAVRLEPNRASLHNNLGHTLRVLGQQDPASLEAAFVELERARELDPDFLDAAFNLGLVCLDRGDLARAQENLEDAVSLLDRADGAPSDTRPEDAWAALGWCYGLAGAMDDAVDALETAVDWGPTVQSLSLLSELLLRMEEQARAVEVTLRFLELFPEEVYAKHLLHEALRHPDGLAALGELAPLESSSAAVLNERAWAQVDPERAVPIGDAADALAAAELAVELTQRGNAAYLDTLAHALELAGRVDEAVDVAAEALALAQDSGVPAEELAMYESVLERIRAAAEF